VLFRGAIQLSISSKHWAEVTTGRPIQVLSVTNKPSCTASLQARAFDKAHTTCHVPCALGLSTREPWRGRDWRKRSSPGSRSTGSTFAIQRSPGTRRVLWQIPPLPNHCVVFGLTHFWVAAIKSSNPFTIAVSAQPGFKRDPSTWNVSAPNAASFGI
jgi:hypothetical protein